MLNALMWLGVAAAGIGACFTSLNASVEFEYLTGFATIFQPPHTVAYQLYTKEGMPSLASLLGVNGYESTAFHPYKSSGWNRPIVYNNMRFDNQLYQEDVDNACLIRNYISDQSDYETIFQITDADRGILNLSLTSPCRTTAATLRVGTTWRRR